MWYMRNPPSPLPLVLAWVSSAKLIRSLVGLGQGLG